MPSLPPASTPEAFDAIAEDEAALAAGVSAIVQRHGLDAPRRFEDGSLPVYAVGDRVLKLYPPCFTDERDRESTALEHLESALAIPTPKLDATGDLDGWGYVIMERLRGRSLAVAWPELTADDRLALMPVIGEAMAQLHALPLPNVDPVGPADWRVFVDDQRASARARQAQRELDPAWLEQIDGFLAQTPLEASGRSLLHTEIMREHLVVEGGAGTWRLTGLFDFEPAMIGAPEYELASVGLFVTCGEPGLLQAILQAYGYEAKAIDVELQRRCMAYALLHKYSNVPWYMKRLSLHGATTFDALAERWWAF